MKKPFITAAFLLLSFGSNAETFDITNVGVDLNQQTFFVGVTPLATASPCARKDEFKWNLSQSGIKEIESLVLTAKATGKKIVIGIDLTNCVAGQATGFFLYIPQQ